MSVSSEHAMDIKYRRQIFRMDSGHTETDDAPPVFRCRAKDLQVGYFAKTRVKLSRELFLVLVHCCKPNLLKPANCCSQADDLHDRHRACFKLCRRAGPYGAIDSHLRNHVSAKDHGLHFFQP